MDERIGYDLKKRSGPEEIERQAKVVSEMTLLQVISEHNSDFVGVLNGHRQFVFINRGYFPSAEAAVELLGMRPGEVFGCVHSHESEFGCGAGPSCAYCDAVKAVVEAFTRDEKIRRSGRILIERGNRSESLDVMINAIPLRHEGDRFIVLHIQDISDQRRMEILERIFYHDVRNTIASLGGILYLSTIESTEIPDAKRVLDMGLQDIVEQIEYHRTLREVEAGKKTDELPVIDFGALLSAFSPLVDNKVFLNGRTLEIYADSGSPHVRANPMILRRILLNLVKNAVEASKAGDRVIVRVRRQGDSLKVSVSNAQYMDPRVQAGVFQHSFSTKGAGRGFGTYSVKLLSQRYLGGDVSFQTSPEAGTTFTLSLPLAEPE